MSIDRADVAHIARLARLKIPDDIHDRLAEELSRIFEWIEQLREVDTDETAPMSSAVEMALKMRDDVISDGDRADEVLANAPETDNGYYVVAKVLE